MERAALFLRGVETTFSRHASQAQEGLPLLMWDDGERSQNECGHSLGEKRRNDRCKLRAVRLIAAAGLVVLIAADPTRIIPGSDQHVASWWSV